MKNNIVKKVIAKMINNDLIEKLSELEHDQWISWSKNIAESEKITPERHERWKKQWVPYSQLSEEDKEKDREWARKVIKIVEDNKNE